MVHKATSEITDKGNACLLCNFGKRIFMSFLVPHILMLNLRLLPVVLCYLHRYAPYPYYLMVTPSDITRRLYIVIFALFIMSLAIIYLLFTNKRQGTITPILSVHSFSFLIKLLLLIAYIIAYCNANVNTK